jgi:hypothetical protein
MSRRCSHLALLIDDFIEPRGAFVSCLFCPASLELSGDAVEHYLPFEYTSPEGRDKDLILLIPARLVGQ